MKPHEEWVDGSWTVDCVCGVNFDDGKEMVNCDECGVWVHTWCSRYVKGDDLFACHKCKLINNDNQVSKLLVTRTLRMESQTVPSNPCTEIPIEERIHVQGVPGGDFERFSSVFSQQLWKCTGYVPKKFRFQYKEFPCWDEKENTEHQEDTCAGVLLSLSKEMDPATDTMRLRTRSREMDMKHSHSYIDKEKSLICPLSTNKGRKGMLGASQDRFKKKVKVADKEDQDDNKDFAGLTML